MNYYKGDHVDNYVDDYVDDYMDDYVHDYDGIDYEKYYQYSYLIDYFHLFHKLLHFCQA